MNAEEFLVQGRPWWIPGEGFAHLMPKTYLNIPGQLLLEHFQGQVAHCSLREVISFYGRAAIVKFFLR